MISSAVRTALCRIVARPPATLAIQLPQLPCSQAEGGSSPAARAAARIVSPAPQRISCRWPPRTIVKAAATPVAVSGASGWSAGLSGDKNRSLEMRPMAIPASSRVPSASAMKGPGPQR